MHRPVCLDQFAELPRSFVRGNNVQRVIRSHRRELGKEYPCLEGQDPRYVPRFPGCGEGSLTGRSVGVLARQGLDSRSA